MRVPCWHTAGERRRCPTNVMLVPALLVFSFAHVYGATLSPETLVAWQEYVDAVQRRIEMRVDGSAPFLWADESNLRLRKLAKGEVIAMPTDASIPRQVAGGLIHDWIGAAYFPNTTLDEVLEIAQDYPRYRDFYKPLVVASKLNARDSDERTRHFRFSLTMVNNSLFSKRGLDETWEESYIRVDENRVYSVARTVSIREIEDYDSPKQHVLPENEGSGYIWRMFAVSRFERRDGGVYVELEALALSRDVPGALRWFADPIIRRISRASLRTSLIETRNAIAGEQTHASVPVRTSSDSRRRAATVPPPTSLTSGVQ